MQKTIELSKGKPHFMSNFSKLQGKGFGSTVIFQNNHKATNNNLI